jgi:hypothetical protein
MNLSRRQLLIGAGALLAAPAIVRAASLMPVRPIEQLGVDLGAADDITVVGISTRPGVMVLLPNAVPVRPGDLVTLFADGQVNIWNPDGPDHPIGIVTTEPASLAQYGGGVVVRERSLPAA